MQYLEKISLLSDEMRAEIAERLRVENLPEANLNSANVSFKETFYTRYVKRAIDIALSGAALVATAPLNLFVFIGTAADVGRPYFFVQQRAGKNGEPFGLVKFRNMTNDTDEHGELLPAKERVTKFGSFVRKTSLDELLNFWSIFKGDMSIIGPRPLTMKAARKFSDRHAARMKVKPGLECPMRGFDHNPTWEERFEHDVWYVENVSFKTDLKLFLDLFFVTFDRKQIANRSAATGHGGAFMGYSKDGHVISLESVPEDILDEVLKEHGVDPDAELNNA